MREKRNEYPFLVGKPEGKNNFEDRDTDGRITFKYELKKLDKTG
jgi:hypothetical protein